MTIPLVLIEDNAVHLASNVNIGNNVTEQTAHWVAVDDDDAAIPLETDTNESAGLVEGELTGVDAASSAGLEVGQSTGGLVDGEDDEGVRWECRGVVRVEVGDGQARLEARRDDDEPAIGLGAVLVSGPDL